MSALHELTIKVQDGEAQVVLLCHAVPTAPCRRRPADWEEDREEWTPSDTDITGFPCWAVEYVEEGGLDQLAYDGPKGDGPFTYAGPVDVWYDECVRWSEAAQDQPLPIGVDLDAIRSRCERPWDAFHQDLAAIVEQDVPALVAEVERLRALLASNHRAYLSVQGIDPDSDDVKRITGGAS